jgi:hypothetical protein
MISSAMKNHGAVSKKLSRRYPQPENTRMVPIFIKKVLIHLWILFSRMSFLFFFIKQSGII